MKTSGEVDFLEHSGADRGSQVCIGPDWLQSQFTERAFCNSKLTLNTFLAFVFVLFLLQIQNVMITTSPLF